MTNLTLGLTVIGVLLFIFGLNGVIVSFSNYSTSAGLENTFPSPTAYFWAGIGSILIVISSITITPIYEKFFKKNKFLMNIYMRSVIFILLLLIGYSIIFLTMQFQTTPALYPVQ